MDPNAASQLGSFHVCAVTVLVKLSIQEENIAVNEREQAVQVENLEYQQADMLQAQGRKVKEISID
jgi:hypothetical protein